LRTLLSRPSALETPLLDRGCVFFGPDRGGAVKFPPLTGA
jgi:hypothetical protein